jgi:uncharacterized membrane protein
MMEKKTGRLEAFSDGIFGVAITLLAIEIGIKEYEGATNASLWKRILDSWPEYFTYFNSFATVLLIWMGHHNIFNRIWKASHTIILRNGLVLLFVVLFPFPTRTVGIFIGTGAVNTAVSFYSAFTGLIVLSMLVLNLGLIKSPQNMINPATSLPWFKKQVKQQVVAILVYFIAAIVAQYSAGIALSMTFLMWVFWAVITKEVDEDENTSDPVKKL